MADTYPPCSRRWLGHEWRPVWTDQNLHVATCPHCGVARTWDIAAIREELQRAAVQRERDRLGAEEQRRKQQEHNAQLIAGIAGVPTLDPQAPIRVALATFIDDVRKEISAIRADFQEQHNATLQTIANLTRKE